MSVLERVEVLGKLARGVRIAAVRCHCGINELSGEAFLLQVA